MLGNAFDGVGFGEKLHGIQCVDQIAIGIGEGLACFLGCTGFDFRSGLGFGLAQFVEGVDAAAQSIDPPIDHSRLQSFCRDG